MKARVSLYCAILVLLALAGCARTQVTGVWKRADFTGPPIESLVILAQTGKEYDRSTWENIIAEQYRGSRVNAVPAISAFPGSREGGVDKVIASARQRGIEGVLVVRHVDTRGVEAYHPPVTHYYYGPGYYPYPYWRGYYRGYYGPYGYRWYDPFYPYYYYDYDVVVTPGYTTYHRVVLVGSYLYQSGTGELVWSLSTETVDPMSEIHLVEDISRSTFRSLQRYGLIRLTR